MKLPMPERDVWWLTYVAEHGDDEGGAIETLISWTLRNGMEKIEDERAQLATFTLAWLLTTSHRAVRDKATKALACLFANRLTLAAGALREFAPVDDLYVFERLLAAVFGATLQGTATTGLRELAETVFSLVFKNGAPPANALLRDHALGLIQYLEWRGELPASVDMTLVRPPYRSAWPIEAVPDELIESYKQDYGKGQLFADAIVHSAVNDGDFARYVIDPVVRRWSPTPIGSLGYPSDLEVCQAWIKEFGETAAHKQHEALVKVMAAAKAAGDQRRYEKTPEREALEAAQEEFRKTISVEAWEDYRVRAQYFIAPTMVGDWRYSGQRASFNSGWARRWVCKRAHEFGWTPKRFGAFDRHPGYDRHDHRIERIGKKYQWLALQELAARMADNLALLGGYGDFGDDKPQIYESARQVGLRDIDPSLLVTQTHYDGWGEWGRTWWVPFNPSLRAIDPPERRAWLDADFDIINDVLANRCPKSSNGLQMVGA